MNQPKHVLDGYKVLDFTQTVAGPTCTLMLAEMGAEVIKVELTPVGDGACIGSVIVDGRSGYFVQHNRGKKDLCLDAKIPEGLAVLGDLDVPGFALRFLEFPQTLELQAPTLGEHNREILTQWLGYTPHRSRYKSWNASRFCAVARRERSWH